MTSSIHVIDALLCVALMMDASHLPALMYIRFSLICLFHVSFSPFLYMIWFCLYPLYIYFPDFNLLYLLHLRHVVNVLLLVGAGLVSFSFLLVCALR